MQEIIEVFLCYACSLDPTMLTAVQLQVYSDASYLSETKSRSRAGGFMNLGKCALGHVPNAPILYINYYIYGS